jgi:hypothetical protein
MASTSSSLTRNNYRSLSPFQGFDLDIYIQSMDPTQPFQTLLGRFSSFQITIRNETIPYAELNTRTINELDGMIAVGWTLERGLISVDDITKRLFGTDYIGHEARLDRFPRFAITVEFNAPRLGDYPTDVAGLKGVGEVTVSNTTLLKSSDGSLRMNKGKIILAECKVDTATLSGMAGGAPVATRIEGLAETIQTQPLTGTDVVDPGYEPEFNNSTGIKNDQVSNLGAGTSTFPSWISS